MGSIELNKNRDLQYSLVNREGTSILDLSNILSDWKADKNFFTQKSSQLPNSFTKHFKSAGHDFVGSVRAKVSSKINKSTFTLSLVLHEHLTKL